MFKSFVLFAFVFECVIQALLEKSKNKSNKYLLPKKIGKYTFVNYLDSKCGQRNFALGVYKDLNGKKYFAKSYKKISKGYVYKSLKNEIKILTILNEVADRNYKTIPIAYRNFNVPKIVFTYENKKNLLYLSEYITGNPLKFRGEAGLKKYLEIIEYLTFLYRRMSEKEKLQIATRRSSDVFSIYFLVLLKALAIRPKMSRSLLKGMGNFIMNSRNFIGNTDLCLVHRDLHSGNIIRSGGNIYVLDFEFAVVASPVHEYVGTLRALRDDPAFYKMLISHLQNKKNNIGAIRASLVYGMTHSLSSLGASRDMVNAWGELLQYVNKSFGK